MKHIKQVTRDPAALILAPTKSLTETPLVDPLSRAISVRTMASLIGSGRANATQIPA